MTNLCYFRFFEFCENKGCKLVSHEKTFASVRIIKDGKLESIPINSPFDDYDEVLKLVSITFGFDLGELINYSKKRENHQIQKLLNMKSYFLK